ncbi:hypothetical protein [Maricaulis parjimensis]|uniref:hypothetical protein n=1 Tax=Maricaulis parjimensis TaxID=144023 RepID=UPI0019397896|nr:hypothetical protein [Maricaulis parjimensis]
MSSNQPASASNVTDFAAFRAREYTRTLDALREAHARSAEGPLILALVNELTCLAEDILTYRCDENGRARPACCPESDRFFLQLSEAFNTIASRNGELDDSFFQLVETLPGEAPRAAA